VALFDGDNYCYEVPEGKTEVAEEALCDVLDSLSDDSGLVKARKVSRAEARRRWDQDQVQKRAEESRTARQAQTSYAQWTKQCDEYFACKAPRTTFKHPPQSVCRCREVFCMQRKNIEGAVGACKHDLEALLRGSGEYSLAWLRRERLRWHPDKFGQRCDSIFRPELTKKATQMYALFEELIHDELIKTDGGDQG
jgi:hypothetical protein